MKITIVAGPVLDTVADDPEERANLAARATASLEGRGQKRDVHPEEIPLQWVATHSVRYEQGVTYEVDAETGGRLRANGWAVAAEENAKVARAKPFDTREASDEHAEEWDANTEARFEEAKERLTGRPADTDLTVQDVRTDSGAQF
jgi:hypothetical protein